MEVWIEGGIDPVDQGFYRVWQSDGCSRPLPNATFAELYGWYATATPCSRLQSALLSVRAAPSDSCRVGHFHAIHTLSSFRSWKMQDLLEKTCATT